MSNIFQNSTILITGGTGTFGSAFLKHLLKLNPKEIRIFSRDEKKQYELSNELSNYKNIKFCIGDVRDFNSVDRATKGVDYVLHAAAMK
jgi:UDP-glucose 4-epimerase